MQSSTAQISTGRTLSVTLSANSAANCMTLAVLHKGPAAGPHTMSKGWLCCRAVSSRKVYLQRLGSAIMSERDPLPIAIRVAHNYSQAH